MSGREVEILDDIISKTGFSSREVIWRSSYWNTKQVGAVLYKGEYEGQPAVLKIQGVKPETSEIYMIEQFTAQNRSKIIRPPHLLFTIPWNDESQYEALITEFAQGKKVLKSQQLQSAENIATFLQMYQEYRANCLPLSPWLEKPDRFDVKEAVTNYLKQSHKAYPTDPRRKESDDKLVIEATDTLEREYKNVPVEFLHGHFSVEDLIYQGDEVVLFSNLFWKWSYPYYDAVLGYHWFIYELNHVKGITPKQVEEQRKLWLNALFNLPQVKGSEANIRLMKASLLERAVAGVILDSFLVDKDNPIAEYLTESSREQVRSFLEVLRA